MVCVLGIDIGGANTKAALIITENGGVIELKTVVKYFPFWLRNTMLVRSMLTSIREELAGSERLDCVGVTMTAELSDVYQTKREGVYQILNCVAQTFQDMSVFVLGTDSKLLPINSVIEPLKIASANWTATGWMIANRISDGVVIDVGSTTTSIIPIEQGKVTAIGKTDLEKLISHELIYTGSLRTNVAAIVSCLPLRGNKVNVSSELFATSGDVHFVLGNIKKSEYTTETADGKGKTYKDSLARIAHVVCADLEMLTQREILQMSKHIYTRQIEQIAEGLDAAYQRLRTDAKRTIPAIVAGLGKDFLARKAAEKASIAQIIDLDCIFSKGVAFASPATGVAFMAATKIEGRNLEWKL